MKLNWEGKRRIAQNLAGFEIVYTFEDKVFVKRNKSEGNKEAICTKTKKNLYIIRPTYRRYDGTITFI